MQTTWVKAYVAWRRVRSATDPVAYTHGILVNAFRSDRRRRSAGELPLAVLPESPVAPPDSAERLALLAALARLDVTDRAVVVLRYWDDLSVAQTAGVLRLTEAAVKNRSLRALRALRTSLSDHLTPTHTRSTS